MKTLGEILKSSTEYLSKKEVGRPRRSSEEILSYALEISRMDLYLQFDRPIQEKELDVCRELLKKRGEGIPIEYLTRKLEFYKCKLEITPDVLIPRPETELLIDFALKEMEGNKVAWDLCCGSGCIGLALKKALPSLSVTLSDLSKGAVDLAKKNAKHNDLAVEVLEGDLFAPFAGKKVDYLFCNPPYISSEEYEALDIEVKDFEPKMALLSGEKGTEFYERIAEEVLPFLNPEAKLFFEIGHLQGEKLQAIFNQSYWNNKTCIKDWAGLDRYFFLQYN